MFNDSLPSKLKTTLEKEVNHIQIKNVVQQILLFPKIKIINIIKNLNEKIQINYSLFEALDIDYQNNQKKQQKKAHLAFLQTMNIFKLIKEIILLSQYFVEILTQGIFIQNIKKYAQKWVNTMQQVENKQNQLLQIYLFSYEFLVWFGLNFPQNPHNKIPIKSIFRSTFQTIPFVKIQKFKYFLQRDKIQYNKKVKDNLSKQIFFDNELKFLYESFQKQYYLDEEFNQVIKKIVQTRDITFISSLIFTFSQKLKQATYLNPVIDLINLLIKTGQIQVVFLINQNLLTKIFQCAFREKQKQKLVNSKYDLQTKCFEMFCLWSKITQKLKLSNKIYLAIFQRIHQYPTFEKYKKSLSQSQEQAQNMKIKSLELLNYQKLTYFSYDPEEYQKIQKIMNMPLHVQQPKGQVFIDRIRQQSQISMSLSSNKGSNSWSKFLNSQSDYLQQQSRVKQSKIVNQIQLQSVFDNYNNKNKNIKFKNDKKYEQLLMQELKAKQEQEQKLKQIYQKIQFQNKIHQKIYNTIQKNNRQSIYSDYKTNSKFPSKNNIANQYLNLKETANFNVGSSMRDTGNFKTNHNNTLNVKEKEHHKKQVLNILKEVQSQNRSPETHHIQNLKSLNNSDEKQKEYFSKYGQPKSSTLSLNSNLKVIAQEINKKYKSHKKGINSKEAQPSDYFLLLQSELKKSQHLQKQQQSEKLQILDSKKSQDFSNYKIEVNSPLRQKNIKQCQKQAIKNMNINTKYNQVKIKENKNKLENKNDQQTNKKINISQIQRYSSKFLKLLLKQSSLLQKNQLFQLGFKRKSVDDKNTLQLYFCPYLKISMLQFKLNSDRLACQMFQNKFINLPPQNQIKFQLISHCNNQQKIETQEKINTNQKKSSSFLKVKIMYIDKSSRKQKFEQFQIILPVTQYNEFKHLESNPKQFKILQEKSDKIFKTQWIQASQVLIIQKKQYLQKLFPKIQLDQKQNGLIKLQYRRQKFWIWIYFVYEKVKLEIYSKLKNTQFQSTKELINQICRFIKKSKKYNELNRQKSPK